MSPPSADFQGLSGLALSGHASRFVTLLDLDLYLLRRPLCLFGLSTSLPASGRLFDFGAPSRVPWKRHGLPPPPSSEAPPIRVCLASTSPNSSLTLLQTAAPTVAVTETDTDPATLGVREPDSRCVRLLPTSSLHQTGATAAPTSTRIESPPASHTRSSTTRASCQSTSRPGRPPRAQRYPHGSAHSRPATRPPSTVSLQERALSFPLPHPLS